MNLLGMAYILLEILKAVFGWFMERHLLRKKYAENAPMMRHRCAGHMGGTEQLCR